MKDIEQILNEMKDAGPGTLIEIKGYTDSSGTTRDIKATLLTPSEYTYMAKQDLEILDESLVDGIPIGCGDDSLTEADFVAARDALIRSRHVSLTADRDEAIPSSYVPVGGSLAVIPGAETPALYIMRLRLAEATEARPAKGALPRAKQELTRILDLPTRYYVHAVKLAPGKFESVEVVKKV